jgi:cell division protein FtsB
VARQGQPALRDGPAAQLDAQQAANEAARERNARLAAEVSDLKEGLEMVEEKARAELGMVRARRDPGPGHEAP